MSFKNHRRQSFIIDTCQCLYKTEDFQAGILAQNGYRSSIAFSAFGAGMLGGHRRGQLAGVNRAHATTPQEMKDFLREAGKPFAGQTIRYTSEATPPTVVCQPVEG